MENEIIAAKGLTVCINGESPVLLDVNIAIHEGDFVFLKGANGSGKTTLLNVLSCYTPLGRSYNVDGKIIFAGKTNILENADNQWYKTEISYVQQNILCYNESVLAVFLTAMTGIKDVSRQDILQWLSRDSIKPLLPINAKKLLETRTASLSEGQRKIVNILAGIMRAEYCKLLIIDEPLNHLDSYNVKEVIELIASLKRFNTGIATIITTHCQAFPEPTQYLIVKNGHIQQSQNKYIQYQCYNL